MKRGITIILAAVMALGLGLGGLSVAKNAQGTKEFISDGYILDPSDEEYVTDNVDTQYYFSAGAKYKEKYGSQIVFKSSTGDNQTIDSQHFIHYNDGSLGAFTKGVLMDVSEINDSNYGYYSLTQNTVLIKNGNSYEMTSRGEAMNITEFIWKISDTDYMLVSPNITLDIGGNDVNFSDYVQLTYVDNGIVRLTHQSGTYQTVAADSKLVTQNGIELNLVGKEFIVDGEPVFSLDDMAIDDDSYIDVDENITDQPTIPTFNVINGKDGANGTDGTDGEQGIEGEEGQEGEQGAEGDQGAEGGSGSAGGSGGDGVEGDSGIMGYDGAEGINGKDAENAASASDIVSADLKARPTVTVDAGDTTTSPTLSNYKVTPGSAQMLLELDNSDNSLIPDTTLVKLYNKATMELVGGFEDVNKQREIGTQLENGSAAFNATGLSADTEYLLVVEGEYEIDNDGNTQKGVLFQKVFRTEPLGIAIAKDHVTDTEISAVTRITGTVDSYDVVFYYYDGNSQKVPVVTYSVSNPGSGATFTVNDTSPSASASIVRPISFDDVKSNTHYYAELANVMSNHQLISTDGSEVELTTLKKTPYDYVKAHESTPSIVPVPQMVPVLTGNNKTRTLTVSLNAIADDDQGILGYKVELYKASDISSALQTTNGLDDLKPTYSKEMKDFATTSFSIPDTDTESYRAKVIAIFDDNEKEAELSTVFSNAEQITGAASSLTVEFVDVVANADKLTGKIKITDGGGNLGESAVWDNTQVLQHIGGSYPLKLEITGQYADTYTISFADLSSTAIDKSGETFWLFNFEQIGLHQDSYYTLRVIGPQDTDGSKTIVGAEATTYLAGLRYQTKTHASMVLMSKKRANATKAFEYAIYVAPTSTDAADVAGATYSASTLTSLELTLSNSDGVRERVLGSVTVLKDSDTRTHDSKFKDTAFKSFSDGEENTDSAIQSEPAGTRGLVLKTGADTSTFAVTPESFGLDPNDNVFATGGIFKITVTGAKDYTEAEQYGGGGNDIPFIAGQDVIMFGIEKSHLRASDPNDCVDVIPLTNESARSGYEETGVANDTVVGLRFRADYGYSDINEIYYNIYELVDSEDVAVTDYIYSDGTLLTKVSDDEFSNTTTQKCNLVLTGKHQRSGNEYQVSDVELYFKGSKSPDDYIEWKKADNSAPGDEEFVLSRGKRYIISYVVKASHEITPHTDPSNDHMYPACVYPGTKEPLYRSAVIDLEKQMPVVERYPLSSTTGNETWNYRIIDPDNAVIVDGSGNATLAIKKATSFALTSATDATLTMTDVASYKTGDFASYTISGLTDKQFYTIGVPYKLLTADSVSTEYITSKPMQHFNAQTVSNTNVYLKGEDAVGYDSFDYVSGGTTLKAILNEGNYRLRLTLMGTDLTKFAAFRVVATDGVSTVTYDPVHVNYLGKLTDNTPYAYAYIDQGPLAVAGFEGETITFSISGYYSTRSSGFDGYQSVSDIVTNAMLYKDSGDYENLYAWRNIDSTDGTSVYQSRADQNWAYAKDTGNAALGSLFVPALASGTPSTPANGLTVSYADGGASTAMFSGRFYGLPLNDGASFADNAIRNGLQVDETGIHNGDQYYTVEKLEKAAFDFGIYDGTNISNTTTTLKLGTVVGAIKADNITKGAKSASYEMSLQGRPTSTVYAKVYRYSGGSAIPQQISKHTEGDNNEIEFFTVDGNLTDPEATYYAIGNYSGNAIAVTSNKLHLRLRGLSTDTEYGVMFFVYDADGNIRPLYSIDPGVERVGYTYTIKTLKYVTINMNGPTFTYSAYNNKTASFRFGIPGDEGVGMQISYVIVSGTDFTDPSKVVDSGTVNPLGTGSYLYYSQRPDQNNPIVTNFNPGSGILKMGGTYSIHIEARSISPDEYLGKIEKTFYMENTLDDPAFRVSLTAEGSDLKATIVTTDIQKSIMNGYKVELFDASDLTQTVKPAQTVTFNSGFETTRTDEVTFTSVPAGNYLVRVTAEVDKDNNGIFNEATADKYVIAETMSNAGIAANASLGASATLDDLTIRLTSLSNFESVRKIYVTAYNETNTAVYIGNFDITETEAQSALIEKTLHWQSNLIEEGKWHTVQIQFRSETNGLLGNAECSVKPESSSTP